MDPVCHTLVGATLSRAGLDRLTRRATGALMLAANAPDVDILALFVGRNLEWRRGVTHGIPALLVWPFIIAAAVWLWDRVRRPPGRAPVSVPGLLAISALGAASHPFLDYLNVYGMRWLMPLRDQWFYGDSVFIVDPWLYLVLGMGLWGARVRRRRGAPDPARPARIGLFSAVLYLGMLLATTARARTMVIEEWAPDSPRFMTAPVPVNPFRKRVILPDGEVYRVGTVDVWPGGRVRAGENVPRGAEWEAARRALEGTREGRAFLRWSRFPVVRTAGDGSVAAYDLRYSGGSDTWATISVPAPPP